MTPSCSFETVTPEIAKAWLAAGNRKNRKISEPACRRLAGAILRGEWMDTTDAIGLAVDGAIVNGQHRLSAIIIADTSVSCLVVRNVNPEIIKVIDQGAGRTFAQWLAMDGLYSSHAAIAAGVSRLYDILNNYEERRSSEFSPTTPQLIDLFDKHPGVEQSVEPARAVVNKLGMQPNSLTAQHYLMASVHPELATEFFIKLETGLGLEDGSPIYVAREMLIAESHKVDQVSGRMKVAWVVNAWELFRRGSTPVKPSKIKWVSTGARLQPYPKVTNVTFLTEVLSLGEVA